MTSCSQCNAGAQQPILKSDSVVNFVQDDFARQVLGLAIGDSEDAFEARLTENALRYGLTLDGMPDRRQELNSPASDDVDLAQRSFSTDSHHTTSSSILTFDLSRSSQKTSDDISSTPSSFRRGSEVFSAKDHDSSLSSARTSAIRSATFPQLHLPSESTQSLPSSNHSTFLPSRNPRRSFIRGFSRLRPRRTVSTSSVQRSGPTICRGNCY